MEFDAVLCPSWGWVHTFETGRGIKVIYIHVTWLLCVLTVRNT
jgi:hypothetical protein